jgi:hypothetical protein
MTNKIIMKIIIMDQKKKEIMNIRHQYKVPKNQRYLL